jgi:hypothetical protein
MLGSEKYFHCHVAFVYFQALRTSGFICFITYNISHLDSLVVLCNTLNISKVEYGSTVWKNLTPTDSNEIKK